MVFGAVVASSANTKTAAARSNPAPFTANQLQAPTASVSSVPANASSAPPAMALVAAPSEVITAPPADLNLENPKLRRMQRQEITQGMLATAAKIVRKHYAKPVGTQIDVEVDGKHVIARIERHFHPEGGPVKPWGFHPGVSLFVLR